MVLLQAEVAFSKREDYPAAEALGRRALELGVRTRDLRTTVPAVVVLACATALAGRRRMAARLWGVVQPYRDHRALDAIKRLFPRYRELVELLEAPGLEAERAVG